MKIAIIGYGKMGKAIEKLAVERGHEIVLKISRANLNDLSETNLQKANVAIEFSRPETAFENISACFRAGIPVVCGTTGWPGRLEEAKALCQVNNGAFLYASNFSIGVNLFFALNRYLAGLMQAHEVYQPSMAEIHHTQKLDAPSGTAISLADDILAKISRIKSWVNESAVRSPQSAAGKEELIIVSKREENVPGTHIIEWASAIDTIEISHTAHSREGFAAGALAAAQWLIGKNGCFEMKDVLKIEN